MNSDKAHMIKQRTIEGIFISGAAKRSAKHLVKQAINESFLSKTTVANINNLLPIVN